MRLLQGLHAVLLAMLLASATGCAIFRKEERDPDKVLAEPYKNRASRGSAYREEEEDSGFMSALSPKLAYRRFKVAIGRGPNENVANKALAEGEALFRQKQYLDAAAKYAVAADRWPDSPQEEEALFKAGECYFFSDRYPKADDNFGELVKKYPGTQYLDRVVARRFAIGRYWEQYANEHPQWPTTPNITDKTRTLFDTHGHALRVYDRVRLDDPTGPLADDSIMATANAMFVKARYEDADYYYTLLRTDYPKSEHQFQAHLLGLKSKLLKYQGPDYEGAPLVEAEELVTQILTQFPTELGDERERMLAARGEIRAQQAVRDYSVAEYYQKNKYYGASKVYYENVATKYPDTRLAQEARARIEDVRDKPPVPVNHLQWLVDVFPESKKQGPTIAAAPTTSTLK